MSDYNFWADLFDTWQSSSDWIKALMILTPPVFALGMAALLLHHRARMQRQPVSSGHYQLVEEHPASDISNLLTAEAFLLNSLVDLKTGLEQAKQKFQPTDASEIQQKSAEILRPEVFQNKGISEEEIRALARKIIADEYRRGRPPGETLQRVRQFLLDRDDESETQ